MCCNPQKENDLLAKVEENLKSMLIAASSHTISIEFDQEDWTMTSQKEESATGITPRKKIWDVHIHHFLEID